MPLQSRLVWTLPKSLTDQRTARQTVAVFICFTIAIMVEWSDYLVAAKAAARCRTSGAAMLFRLTPRVLIEAWSMTGWISSIGRNLERIKDALGHWGRRKDRRGEWERKRRRKRDTLRTERSEQKANLEPFQLRGFTHCYGEILLPTSVQIEEVFVGRIHRDLLLHKHCVFMRSLNIYDYKKKGYLPFLSPSTSFLALVSFNLPGKRLEIFRANFKFRSRRKRMATSEQHPQWQSRLLTQNRYVNMIKVNDNRSTWA